MLIIVVLAVGMVLGFLISKYTNVGKSMFQPTPRQKNLDTILSNFNNWDIITNDKVEALLGVSDASAERYLNELEQQGKLQQIGKAGKYVNYKKL